MGCHIRHGSTVSRCLQFHWIVMNHTLELKMKLMVNVINSRPLCGSTLLDTWWALILVSDFGIQVKCWVSYTHCMSLMNTLAHIVYWVKWSASSSLCTWGSGNLLWKCSTSLQPILFAQYHKCMVHLSCSVHICSTTMHHDVLHNLILTIGHCHDPLWWTAFHLNFLH